VGNYETYDDLVAAVGSLGPADVLFWTGAGISVEAPSCLPLGPELVGRVFSDLFLSDAHKKFVEAYKRLGIDRSLPRLEMLLDVASTEDAHGLRAFDVLTDFAATPPNALHRFFAGHLQLGGEHVTANFDTAIEQAAGHRASPLHFHGSIGNDPSQLGATLRVIQGGFTAPMRSHIVASIKRATMIVFVGYSGSDFFDVDPLIAAMKDQGLLDSKRLLWLDHQSQRPQLINRLGSGLGYKIASDPAGAEFVAIAGRTRSILADLFARWHIPLTTSDPPQSTPRWTTGPAPQADRIRATLLLYFRAGHIKAFSDLLSQHPEFASWAQQRGFAGEVARVQGRYSDARRHWRRQHSGANVDSRHQRRLFTAKSHWYQGRLVVAHMMLRTLQKQPGLRHGLRVDVAETQVRVARHLYRSPDTRLLGANVRFVDAQQDHLAELLSSEHYKPAARREAAGEEVSPNDVQVEFVEREHLGGVLNYRHAAIRKTGADADDIRRHVEGFEAIGYTGDAVRAMFLPSSANVFTWRDIAKALRRTQFAPWHTARLIAARIAQRTRPKPTRHS